MMVEAGLLVTGEDVQVPYDRFRDRVMFPIADLRGRVVAFGGRALSAEVPAKYLNSPDTPLFNKGRLLYNYHLARKPAHERGTVVAVEGYVDVISLSVAGFPNVVAPLGTALTEDQLALLWRMADEPILCFDGDKAGRRAAYRALDIALPNLGPASRCASRFCPEGQDPDDLARAGGAGGGRAGARRGAAARRHALGAGDGGGPLDTPERRAALERRLREALCGDPRRDPEALLPRGDREPPRRPQSRIRDAGASRRRARRPAAPGAIGAVPLPITPQRARSASARSSPAARCSSADRPRRPREAMILGAFLVHPELLHNHAETLAELELEGRAAQDAAGLPPRRRGGGRGRATGVVLRGPPRAGRACKKPAARLIALVRPGRPLGARSACRSAATRRRIAAGDHLASAGAHVT